MARDHIITNYCTPLKKSDRVWTFGSNKKNLRSTKSDQLALDMEMVFFPKERKR